MNIRVVGVAPGIVKTPIWTADKVPYVDEKVDKWVSPRDVAVVMLKMVQDKEMVGGTIMEVGFNQTRKVEELVSCFVESVEHHSPSSTAIELQTF